MDAKVITLYDYFITGNKSVDGLIALEAVQGSTIREIFKLVCEY